MIAVARQPLGDLMSVSRIVTLVLVTIVVERVLVHREPVAYGKPRVIREKHDSDLIRDFGSVMFCVMQGVDAHKSPLSVRRCWAGQSESSAQHPAGQVISR